jgi:uncharacterized membrane protein YebE (DUF533 family)
MFDAKSLLNALINAGSQMKANASQQTGPDGQPTGGLTGMLGNLASQVQGQVGSAAAGGGIGGLIGSVLGQATQGLQDAANKSGLSQKATDVVGQATGGKTPGDLMTQAKDMLSSNPGASAAVLGTLGALVFGTSAGRGVAASAAKLGGLALIGGLAYKAYQNYSAGKPILASDKAVLPAPEGSGFEAEIASNETAVLFIRAMIAAAAADGTIDETERNAIIGGLTEAGFDPEANSWLESEMANPASVDDLVEGATSAELQAQVYTAARLAINPDKRSEKDFLAGLAGALGLDAELVANIDAAALSAKA